MKNVWLSLMLLSFVGLGIFITYVTFKNPDMTETRLFLTYWKEVFAGLVLFIIGAIGLRITEE